jgi:hypothetical protein
MKQWSFYNLLEANEILDAIDEVEAEQEAINRAKNPPRI